MKEAEEARIIGVVQIGLIFLGGCMFLFHGPDGNKEENKKLRL